MWLGQYQRRPNQEGEGQVGRVTIGGEQTAVLLDSERRGLEVYAPGGYRWTPRVDQKVLVIQGRGEIPCVVGVRQDQTAPDEVTVESQDSHLNLAAEGAELTALVFRLPGKANCTITSPAADVAVSGTQLPVLGALSVTQAQ